MRRPLMLASIGLGVLSAVLIAGSLVMVVERPTVVRVAVSSTDADDYDLMVAAAKLLKRGHHDIRLKVVNADGTAAAAASLENASADLAVVRADVDMPPSGETVVLLHKDVGLLVAPGGGEVAKIGDLAGKTIGVVAQQAGDGHMLEAALGQYDLAPDAAKLIPLKLDDVAGAVKAKTVDAVYVVGMVSSGQVPAAVRAVAKAGEGGPVFLPIAEAAAIADRSPAYASIEVVRGAFGGSPPRPADEFDTLGVTYRLVANSDLSQGVVASLTRFLLSERVALAQIAPVARRMEAPSTDKGAALPVHPGTAAYIDDEEETFFDKYSDFIYIGAMVLGVMASGLTAVVSRFGGNGGVRVEDLLARLMAIFKAVRTATTASDLDQHESEVDEIVSSALAEGCLRSLDERRVATLTMAIDQVRAAIHDRREALRRSKRLAANDDPSLSFDKARTPYAPLPDRAQSEG